MYEKLKSFLADDATFYALLLLLVGVVSFGLGRWSVMEELRPAKPAAGVVFTDTSEYQYPEGYPRERGEEGLISAVSVVASRSGTKYHLPECPGAEQMKEENKVFFDSIPLAKAAGYTAAANCPGLK